MWYEILPSVGIIMSCMLLPQGVCYVCNRIGFGNPYRRTLVEIQDRWSWHRDSRITGDPYKMQGLEAIPDK